MWCRAAVAASILGRTALPAVRHATTAKATSCSVNSDGHCVGCRCPQQDGTGGCCPQSKSLTRRGFDTSVKAPPRWDWAGCNRPLDTGVGRPARPAESRQTPSWVLGARRNPWLGYGLRCERCRDSPLLCWNPAVAGDPFGDDDLVSQRTSPGNLQVIGAVDSSAYPVGRHRRGCW